MNTTIDRRTRFAGAAMVMEAGRLFGDLAERLRETGPLAARGVQLLDLPPLTFEVEGTAAHLVVVDGALVLRDGRAGDGPVIALDATACSELFQDIVSTFGLVMPGRVQVLRPRADQFVAWEPALRAAIDGWAVYEPGSIGFHDRNGNELDLRRSFRIDDGREDIGHFLAEAGYLHLEGVFTKSEMAAVSAELDAAMAEATRDDGASWWARTEDGWYPSRILGFNLKSPTLQELLESDRFTRIGTFTDDMMVQRSPRTGDSAEGLLKKVNVLEGISDVSWHKDCSLGGHSRGCCALTVGISITGAQQRNGELGVVAGSSRANVQPIDVRPDLDLPRVPLPTNTGDVTVHCSCTLHMSRPPIDRERRVAYTGFGLATRPGDAREELDPEEIRRRRRALSDQVPNIERERIVSAEAFKLDQ
jgi:Phytanoyl-CoA dioxygenase (PhyH)